MGPMGRMLRHVPALALTAGASLLVTLGTASQEAATRATDAWRAKVAPEVLESASAGPSEFLVVLGEQADLSAAAGLLEKRAKGELVFRALTEAAARTQPPLLEQLRRMGAEARPFWVVNMIWTRGDLSAVRAMAQRPEVSRVLADPQVPLRLPASWEEAREAASPSGTQWNLAKVLAPEAWALGYTGEGVLVGIMDTGTDWTHPVLKGHYRGWNGISADHNYNWHDAIHDGSSACGPDVPYPCDDYGHGTPVAGVVLGDDGGSVRLGVAPGAKWIACRCMDKDGYGSPARYSECLQWFIAPTDLGGQNPDPAKAPHVLNSSWGCVAEEGCRDPLVLKAAVESVRAAGIFFAAAAGNEGPGCGTTAYPPSNYAASFDVGASDENDQIASFSSRGPALGEGDPVVKPDVVAPGTNIRSCKPGAGYLTGGGTSAASPHLAGVAALLLSANPHLAGRVGEVEAILRETAAPKTTPESCGGVPGSERPNNTFGWGRADALAAVRASCTVECAAAVPDAGTTHAALVFQAQAEPAGVCPAGSLSYEWDFGDGSARDTGASASHAYALAGTYTWSLTAALDERRCTRSGSIRVADPIPPPSVSSVGKRGSPFRLVLTGSGFQPGIQVTLGSDPSPWPVVTLSGTTSLTLGSGKTLKAKFPKGQAVPIRLVNPDGGEATATYTRP